VRSPPLISWRQLFRYESTKLQVMHMIGKNRPNIFGRRRFLEVATGALATTQLVSGHAANARLILDNSKDENEPGPSDWASLMDPGISETAKIFADADVTRAIPATVQKKRCVEGGHHGHQLAQLQKNARSPFSPDARTSVTGQTIPTVEMTGDTPSAASRCESATIIEPERALTW